MEDRNSLTTSSSGLDLFIPQQYAGSWADAPAGAVDAEEAETAAKMGSLNVATSEPKLDGLNPADANSKLEVVKASGSVLSASTWKDAGLKSPELHDALVELRFTSPSKIQAVALPAILGCAGPKQNFIGQAQSGSGKTAAFALGFLDQLTKDEYPQALVIAPTQELAEQIHKEVKRLGGKLAWLKTFFVVKDTKSPKQPVTAQVIVGTPGQLFTFATKASKFFSLKKVKVFVLDEADNVMVSMKENAERLRAACPPDCQTLFFSATWPETVAQFAQKMVKEPYTFVRLKPEEVTVEGIYQFYVKCNDDKDKFDVLEKMFETLTIGQSIIFVHKIEFAKSLAENLKKAGHTVAQIHSDMEPWSRRAVMQDFRDGKSAVLIATNVASRGIDVPAVTMVVNYDLPMNRERQADVETYIHRIGRTGRMGRKGIALSFLHDQHALKVWKDIVSAPEMKLATVKELPKGEELYDKLEALQKELQNTNK